MTPCPVFDVLQRGILTQQHQDTPLCWYELCVIATTRGYIETSGRMEGKGVVIVPRVLE